MNTEAISEKVRRDLVTAREQLLRLEPFWAYLLLRLPLVEDATLDAAAQTDGKTITYNPALVNERLRSIPQLVFLLAHELLHVLLGHHFRRGGRDPEAWNVACDYAVNAELSQRFGNRRHQLDLPGWILLEPAFAGWSAEAIYSTIHGPRRTPAAQGLASPHKTSGKSLSPSQIGQVTDPPDGAEVARQELVRHVAQAQVVANATGLGPHVAGSVRRTLHSTTLDFDWESALASKLAEASGRRGLADYSYARCRIPEFVTTGLYQPVLVDLEPPAIRVAVDTSGSMSEKQLAEIEAGLDNIRLPYPELEIPVVYSDTRIRSRQLFGPGEPIRLEPQGGGGTDYADVFRDDQHPCDLLVFFTDLLVGSFPPPPTHSDVLWIYTGFEEEPPPPPYGELARLRT